MKNKLTIKQKLFCQHYIETLGNGTESILRAGYRINKKDGHPDRILAKSLASENLTKPHILAYINSLLEKSGLNDENVAAQHWFLVNQSADLSVKARAIDMYYKLRNKYAQTDNIDIGVHAELHAVIEHIRTILPIAGQ
ncbi:MAG: terminase small subunit [Candidatus Woesebacteria bacterium]|nr:MAG: terminase small subunit [Candidatus Woesebacteria bacterium]